MASPVVPGKKIQLFGTYCSDHGKSWNPDSGQPDVKSWKAGRDDFQAETGAPFLNGGNIFCGNSNAWLKGNVAHTMGLVNQVYPNPPYDYIPSLGCKLYQVNEKSPSTGKAYGWNDTQAYRDVAAGLWDASWTGVVDAMVAAGRPVWFQRVAYEGNAAFMQDFCGYDGKDAAKIGIWCAAVRRAFSVIKNRAAQVGAYPIMGINPTSLNDNNPNVENLFQGVGPDVQNMIAFDFYNGYWGLSGYSGDATGKVAGVGPTQSALNNMWNSQNGAVGFNMASALARKYKVPLTILETGSSGGSHHMLDDPYFYPWLADAIQKHRAAGGTMIMANIWSVPAGDGNTSVQYGSQPATLNSLKGVVSTIIGDAFDPTALAYGGSVGSQPPQPPITTPPPVVTPPINPAVSPTSISVEVVPAATVKSEPYAFVATAVGNPWSAVGNVQHQITLPQNNNSSSGWVTPPAASVALDATGMIATVSGLISGMVMPHTVQFRDSANPGVVSPMVTYPTNLAPVTPPPSLVTHPLTITYSDGSPSITLQVTVGVTASFTVLPPSRPPPGPEGPGQIMTVTFVDHTLAPLVTTHAVGTTATVTTPVTVTYSDGTPDVVLAAVAGSVSVTEPARPQQTTTVSFSDERLPPIVSMNEPGTTVTFS